MLGVVEECLREAIVPYYAPSGHLGLFFQRFGRLYSGP